MSKQNHYPHMQQFNVSAKPNKVKTNSWWNPASKSYWRNRNKH